MPAPSKTKTDPAALYEAVQQAIVNFKFAPHPKGEPLDLAEIIIRGISKESDWQLRPGEPGDIAFGLALNLTPDSLEGYATRYTQTYVEILIARKPELFTASEEFRKKPIPAATTAHEKAKATLLGWVKVHMEKLHCGDEGIDSRFKLLEQEFDSAISKATEALLGKGAA